MTKWVKNGRWERNGKPCHPVSSDYEEMIRWRNVEIDNLHEENRKLRALLEPSHSEYWRLPE